MQETGQLSDKLAWRLQAQQQVLIKTSETNFVNTGVTFKIVQILSKQQNEFSDGKMVNEAR